MLFHTNPSYCIYFGDARDELYPRDYLHRSSEQDILATEPFSRLHKIMPLSSLLFLNQTHEDNGFLVGQSKSNAAFLPFEQEGDFLITGTKQVGIGVMTADCLPIVIYDALNNAAAIVHAGWRGSMERIAVKALERMQQEFDTSLDNIRIFFGPSAGVCCYQVQRDFLTHLEAFSFADKVIQQHGMALFFDLPLFNKLQLEEMGVPKQALRMEYNVCTICDDSFFSYRRQGEKAGRQMTVVCLQ